MMPGQRSPITAIFHRPAQRRQRQDVVFAFLKACRSLLDRQRPMSKARFYSQPVLCSSGGGPSCFSIAPPQRGHGGNSCPFLTLKKWLHAVHL